MKIFINALTGIAFSILWITAGWSGSGFIQVGLQALGAADVSAGSGHG